MADCTPSIPCHTPSTFSNCASDERGYWKIRVRQDTAENWAKNDPILASGEMGYVIGATSGPNLKIGDGWVKWSQLPWLVDGQGGGGGVASGNINSTGFTFGNPPYAGGPTYVAPNSIAAYPSANYPIQDYIVRLEAALKSGQIANSGSNTSLWKLNVGNNTTIGGVLSVSGGIKYGGTISPLRADGEPEYFGGFELPPPTADGFLRSDADDENWYFSEPVIVSDTQPPDPKAKGTLWVIPDGGLTVTPNQPFSSTNPPVYASAPVVEQPNGLPIGLSADGQEIHQPYMVGGVPVMVNGKRYLFPLIEAPAVAPGADPTPLFTYSDPPVTKQLDGTVIGLSADGMELTQPYMVGGIYVLIGGKRYLVPVIEE